MGVVGHTQMAVWHPVRVCHLCGCPDVLWRRRCHTGTILIDECLIDDSSCEELESAIREFQVLRGQWSGINA